MLRRRYSVYIVRVDLSDPKSASFINVALEIVNKTTDIELNVNRFASVPVIISLYPEHDDWI